MYVWHKIAQCTRMLQCNLMTTRKGPHQGQLVSPRSYATSAIAIQKAPKVLIELSFRHFARPPSSRFIPTLLTLADHGERVRPHPPPLPLPH